MFFFRKFQAAEYHYKNVLNFLEEDKHASTTFGNFEGSEDLISNETKLPLKSSLTIEKPANHYVYELSAFLEALKSTIDFLATVAGFHIKGVQLDSISTLMNMVKKGRTGLIFDQIKTHYEWLSYIRDYRHHLVHRLILYMSSVYKKIDVFNQSKTYLKPITVPKKPPKNILDTRENRLLGDGFSYERSRIEIKTKYGEKSIRTHFEYLPDIGYIPIKDFMENQLKSFRLFFKDIIDILTTLEFKQY